MLCGIGGRTIEEAQNNISYEEFIQWVEYRRLRGSLHFGMRIEQTIAVVDMIIANRYRNEKTKPEPYTTYDFSPHSDEPEITLDDMRKWK